MSNDIRAAAVQARDKFARLRAAVDEVLMPIGNMDPDGRMKALTRMTTFHSVAHAGIIKELLDAYDTAALAAAPVPQPPQGWKLVPVEPTEEMWTAGRDPIMYRDVKYHVPESMESPPWRINPATGEVERDMSKGTTAVHVWRAMLAVAPAPQQDGPSDAEMLDWMEANCGAWTGDGAWHSVDWGNRKRVEAPTLREAIRAAMRETGGKTE